MHFAKNILSIFTPNEKLNILHKSKYAHGLPGKYKR